ncbi:hypothetical protein ACMS4H_005112, partial [Escherichia coli]
HLRYAGHPLPEEIKAIIKQTSVSVTARTDSAGISFVPQSSRSCNIIFQSNEKPFIHVIPTITSLLTIPPTMFCDGTLPPFRYLPASTGTRMLSNKPARIDLILIIIE